MINVHRRTPQEPKMSTAGKWGAAASAGAGNFLEQLGVEKEKEAQKMQLQKENEAIKREFDFDISGVYDPKQRQQIVASKLKGEGAKGEREREESLHDYEAAADTVNRMREIRKKGNLGRGSSVFGYFGGETAKHRGEYQTLGNSLIQIASTIPIRNREEFKKLAGSIGDPDITDAEAEGILNGLEKIINDSVEKFGGTEKGQVKEKRPPLGSFKR